MTQPTLFFVGRSEEVAHHAAPLRDRLNVRIAEAPEVLATAKPTDLAIFYSEHFDRFRDCCQQLKKRNIATLYMIDGILEWRNAWENRHDEVACPFTMRPVLSHKVACIGPSQARVLNSWGNVGKTEVVGIPRFDHLSADVPIEDDSDEFRVLIMTAKTPGFTTNQLAKVEASLRDLKKWQLDNTTIQGRKTRFTWRLTGGLADSIGVENSMVDPNGPELEMLLAKNDAVVTTPSTAMLEAMILDRPVALLDYHNCPHYVSAGWKIGGPNEIDSVLEQLAIRPESRMHFQRCQLADALSGDGRATDRLVDLAKAMLEIAAKQNAESRSLEFPSRLLECPDTGQTPFDHQKIYPDRPEFQQQDRSLLQVELAHARREIRHLLNELDQRQAELNQAHQIFEQIEKHPLAGPVVRIRQKMLDLMAAVRKESNSKVTGGPIRTIPPDNSNVESTSN